MNSTINLFSLACKNHDAEQIFTLLESVISTENGVDAVNRCLKSHDFYHLKDIFQRLASDERVLLMPGQTAKQRNESLLQINTFISESIIHNLTVVDLLHGQSVADFIALNEFIRENPRCLLEMYASQPNLARLALCDPLRNPRLMASLPRFYDSLNPVTDAATIRVIDDLNNGVTKMKYGKEEIIDHLRKTGRRPDVLAHMLSRRPTVVEVQPALRTLEFISPNTQTASFITLPVSISTRHQLRPTVNLARRLPNMDEVAIGAAPKHHTDRNTVEISVASQAIVSQTVSAAVARCDEPILTEVPDVLGPLECDPVLIDEGLNIAAKNVPSDMNFSTKSAEPNRGTQLLFESF